MTQLQSDEKHSPDTGNTKRRSFAEFWMGIFFMLSSFALLILMTMFILVWQPIWTEGFEDFHTISNAIDKLNKTAQPASRTIPLMLVEMEKINKGMHQMNLTMHQMNKMNSTMFGMQNIMQDMSTSIAKIDDMTPDIKRMSISIDQMSLVLSNELPRMNYQMDRVRNKMPNMDFIPFN